MKNSKEYNVTWNPTYPTHSDTVSVTKTVHIKEFPTYVLVGDLYNRIYDSIHDEEPRSDRFLESLGEYEKDDLRQALMNLVDNL